MDDADKELAAIQAMLSALNSLDSEAQNRALEYIISRLKVGGGLEKQQPDYNNGANDAAPIGNAAPTFHSFAELYDAANPESHADRALLAGYWLQECLGADNFDSQSANMQLKHLGHGLLNITRELGRLVQQKPALVWQLRKSGNSQQSRKFFKITVAGSNRVKEMMSLPTNNASVHQRINPHSPSSESSQFFSTEEIAEKIGPKTGPNLALAAGMHLILCKKKETFTRQELHEAMKTASSIYTPSMGGNLTPIIKTLKKQKFNEPKEGFFTLTPEARRDLNIFAE